MPDLPYLLSRHRGWRVTIILLGMLLLSACSALSVAADTPRSAADTATVRLEMRTELGPILIEIYPDKAPLSAGNFLRHVEAGSYDKGSFYRTVRIDNDRNPATIQVVQGGLGRPDLPNPPPSPFSPIAHESTASTGLHHDDGALSLARGAPGTASSEFFISVGANPALDSGGTRNPDGLGFAVFGRVIEGMALVRRIHQLSANAAVGDEYVRGQMLDVPVQIESIRRVE
ncbi:MAG: peptidylprolyl isomerase [Pseudomonadota bacterium]|nr:peptidylprolyl isomerase [Pseudomonadota bacterium]